MSQGMMQECVTAATVVVKEVVQQTVVKILPPRLTHFLCLPLARDPVLTAELVRVQREIVERHKLPPEICVNVVDDLHVTVALFSLQTLEDVQRVLEIVEATKVSGPKGGIDIAINGIGRFGERVLWARPVFDDEEKFRSLVQWRAEIYQSAEGLVMKDGHGFTPHATIAKTSKLRRSRRKVAIDEDVEKTANETVPNPFLAQAVYELELFSCKKDKQGRYIRCGKVQFQA